MEENAGLLEAVAAALESVEPDQALHLNSSPQLIFDVGSECA